jgi:hypothetical protein
MPLNFRYKRIAFIALDLDRFIDRRQSPAGKPDINNRAMDSNNPTRVWHTDVVLCLHQATGARRHELALDQNQPARTGQIRCC